MKTAVSISVKTPCNENYGTFKKTTLGGFCNSCVKEVVDFTQMNETEIISYFSTPRENTCGRFTKNQIGVYNPNTTRTMNRNLVSKGMAVFGFSLVALCATGTLNAQSAVDTLTQIEQLAVMGGIEATPIQEQTLKGTVVDEENVPLPGVNVILKGTTIGTTTDFDGAFTFPKSVASGSVLVFSYLGYETKYYEVPESTNEILDITIKFDHVDMELMGAVVVDGVYTSKRSFFKKVADLFR